MTIEQLIQKIEKITTEIDGIKGVYEHLAGTDKLIEHHMVEAVGHLNNAQYYMRFPKETPEEGKQTEHL